MRDLSYTPFDNISPGHWVAVVGHLDYDGDRDIPCGEWPPFHRTEVVNYNGIPWKVLAVSYPFVCATDGTSVKGFDMRKFKLQRITRKYAEAMLRVQPKNIASNSLIVGPWVPMSLDDLFGRPDKPPEPGPSKACPLCNGPLIERLTEGERDWKIICSVCGFTGGRPGASEVA